jgi:hypothetical protein
MSNVSNRHNVIPFVAGKTAALTGQRLAKVGYKKTALIPNPLPSVAISVPYIQPSAVQENYLRLLPYIGTMLETAQDGIVRSLYESSDGVLTSVSDDDISLNACIAFMEAEANGNRLKKETIVAWFVSEMAAICEVIIAEKLKFTVPDGEELNADQRKTIAPYLAAVKEIFSTLAGGKTMLFQGKIDECRFYLSFAPDGSETAQRLVSRLNSMEKKLKEEQAKSTELMDALGFADA